MPIPFLIGPAILEGLINGRQAVSNNNKAKDYIEDAKREDDRAKSDLDEQRNITSPDLEI